MKDHVAMIIRDNQNKLLFIKRSMMKKTLPGIWAFPTGTIEDGENVIRTAMRESNEELGVTISAEKILLTKDLPELAVKIHFLLCRIKEGQPSIKQPEEIDRFEWMTIKEFFEKFSDSEIGHGLVWMRQNPEVWNSDL